MSVSYTQISSSVAIQNIAMMDLINRDYLDGSWFGADYVFVFPSPSYPKTLDEHYSFLSLSRYGYDLLPLTINTSFDSLYLSHVDYFKSNFLCKDNCDFKAYHYSYYHQNIGYTHHTYHFDFFNMFNFETVKKISFNGCNRNNSGTSGLFDDSKINYFNGSLIEHVFTAVNLYSIRKDDFWMPISISLFKYSDRWIFVVPTKFSVDWSTWNYFAEADVYEVKLLTKCCLAECFGITE